MPELWAYRLHTLTVITPPSLKSSAWRPGTLKDLPALTPQQEKMARILEESLNTEEFSSERYCNGVTGVPITFLDKHNPEQFEILKFKKGNDGKDLTYTKNELDSLRTGHKPSLRTSGYLSERYCNGIFGVPITFLDKYNSAQFEIIGATESEGKGFSNGLWFAESGIAQPLINKQRKYKRLFARKVL